MIAYKQDTDIGDMLVRSKLRLSNYLCTKNQGV